MKNALTAAGMTKLVTSTSRLRKIWISSPNAIASITKLLSGVLVADGAEHVVETGGPGRQPLQFHGLLLRPGEQRVQVLLQGEGFDEQGAVAFPYGRQRQSRRRSSKRET